MSLEGFKFEEYKRYLPSSVSHEQMEFFRQAFDEIVSNRDTSKVSVLCERCGIGKSMFISALIQYVLSPRFLSGRADYFGMIVITDSIERLEGLNNTRSDVTVTENEWMDFLNKWGIPSFDRLNMEQVCLLQAGEPFSEQLKRQECRPIVLMSTQRYFMLSENIRDHLF